MNSKDLWEEKKDFVARNKNSKIRACVKTHEPCARHSNEEEIQLLSYACMDKDHML